MLFLFPRPFRRVLIGALLADLRRHSVRFRTGSDVSGGGDEVRIKIFLQIQSQFDIILIGSL